MEIEKFYRDGIRVRKTNKTLNEIYSTFGIKIFNTLFCHTNIRFIYLTNYAVTLLFL